MPSDSALLVIEKKAAIIKGAIKNRDLSGILNDERLFLLIDPTEDNIAEMLKGKSSRNVNFITHRGSHQG